jgi:hypothetical protein
MPRIKQLVVSGSLIISGSDGSTMVLGSGSKNDLQGDLILKSGSFTIGGGLNAQSTPLSSSSSFWAGGTGTQTSGSAGVTGSSSVTGSSTVIGSSSVTGSSTVTGSVTVVGDSSFTGDVTLDGCLTISCCEPLYDGVIGQLVRFNKTGSLVRSYIGISGSYGNITSQLTAAAASNNGNLYFSVSSSGALIQATYEGSNFDGTRTFLTASGNTDAPNGTVVFIGAPGYQFMTEETLFPVEGDTDCSPIAEFCCDGITLTGDTVISGALDVTGPTNLHGGLIVTGCIEMLCPGDEATSYYGYGGNSNDSKEFTAGQFTIYSSLNSSYGDVTYYVSQSAAENGGLIDVLYGGETYQYQFGTAIFAGGSTRVIFVGSPNLPYTPPPGASFVLGNSGSLLPGADQLMGSGSSTTTSVATFCCDGIVLNGDVTLPSGALDVTGSVNVTGSVSIDGCVEILTSGSCEQYLFTGFSSVFRSCIYVADSGSWLTSVWVPNPPYGDITADLITTASANNDIVTLFDPITGDIIYTELYDAYYNNSVNVIQLSTPNEVFPASYVIGVDGVSILGGNVEAITTEDCFSTVLICDDEVTIGADVTISGSFEVTGSVTVVDTQSCTIYGYKGFAKSNQQFTPGVYTIDFLFDATYANNGDLSVVSASIASTAAVNNNQIRLVTTNGWNTLYSISSITTAGGTGGMILTTSQSGTPLVTPLTVMDVPFDGFATPPADVAFPNPECYPQNIAVIDSDGATFLSSVTSQRSLIIGPDNTAADKSETGAYTVFKFVGYSGSVGPDPGGKGYVLFLDEKYENLTPYEGSIFRASEIYLYNQDTKRYYTPDDLPGGFAVAYDSGSRRTYVQDTTGDVLNISSDGQSFIVGDEDTKFTFADAPLYVTPTDMCLVVGLRNTAYHASALLGTGLESGRANQTVVGKYNVPSSESLFIVGAGGNIGSPSNAFEVTTNGSIILPTTSSTAPSYSGSQGEMFFGDDGAGNYVIWAYLGGAWRSGSLS